MKDVEISISGIQNSGHIIFSQKEELQIVRTVSEFVKRGIASDRIVVLFVTSREAEEYALGLRQSGVEVERLISEKRISFEIIDGLLLESSVESIIAKVTRLLETYAELAKSEGKIGLDAVGRIAANLADLQRYEDALLIELFWEKTIPLFQVPFRVICPYGIIPKGLAIGLDQVHDSPLLIGEVWEITPASYKCAKCGKNVEKEIRIHEPGLMQSQSKVVSTAMKEAQAGWIPFCFDCISTHPVIKPTWLTHEPGLSEVQTE